MQEHENKMLLQKEFQPIVIHNYAEEKKTLAKVILSLHPSNSYIPIFYYLLLTYSWSGRGFSFLRLGTIKLSF